MLEGLEPSEIVCAKRGTLATPVIQDFFFLLSTSPDGRFTFAGRVEWQHGGRTTLMLFEDRVFLRQWHWTERLYPTTSSWSDDSNLFALGQGFRVHVFDLARDLQRSINAQGTTKGVFFGASRELVVRVGTEILTYEYVSSGLVPTCRTTAVQFGSCARHFAYCDRDGLLHFSSGVMRRLPNLIDRLSAAPRRQMLVSPFGDGACVVSWPKNRSFQRASAFYIPADPDSEISFGDVELPILHDARWTAWTNGSLLAVGPSEGGIGVARHDIRDGSRREFGHIDCLHADFVAGHDGSFYLSADSLPGERRRIVRLGPQCIEEIVDVADEYAAVQIGRQGLRALISAGGDASWQLRIGGTEVTLGSHDLNVASRKRTRSPILNTGFGHCAVAAPMSGTAIVYVPGLFSPDRALGQTPFFQHVLFCITRALYREGVSYCVLRSIRDAPRDYSMIVPEITTRVSEAIAALRARGCSRVGILGGSIAGYALLRDLTVANNCSAMMMLSPVHIMSQTTAFRLGYDRADSIADVPQTIAARAAALSTPIAIVHGMQDELSPSYHSSLFMSAVPGSVPKRYVAVEDEGHVFSSFESWQRVVDTFLEFARAHLSPTGLAEAGLTRGSNLGVPAETA